MLSIIAPVYQVEKYLKQAVNCLLSQDIEDMEIILVDDGSTDSSPEICEMLAKEYDNITFIRQGNTGVSSARNNGLRHAKGDLIAFLDPDDFIDDGYYSAMLERLEAEGSDIVFSKYKKAYSDGTFESIDEDGFDMLSSSTPDLSVFFNNIMPEYDKPNPLMGYIWRSIFRRDIIDKYNITFNESIDYSEDLLFLLEYLSHAKSSCILESYGYNYRIRTDSATAVSYKNELYKTRKHCLTGYTKIFENDKNMTEEARKALINRIKYVSAKEIIYNEMRFSKAASQKLKQYYADGFSDLFLCTEALEQAKKDNLDKASCIILTLAKKKILSPVKALYSLKYRNEQE